MIGWTGGHRCPAESPEFCELSRGVHSLLPPSLSLGGKAALEVRGGHSLFSFTSSLAESPVVCEATLELRGPGDEGSCFFVCCSNRPMRLATLLLWRSSGNGLDNAFHLSKRAEKQEQMTYQKIKLGLTLLRQTETVNQ